MRTTTAILFLAMACLGTAGALAWQRSHPPTIPGRSLLRPDSYPDTPRDGLVTAQPVDFGEIPAKAVAMLRNDGNGDAEIQLLTPRGGIVIIGNDCGATRLPPGGSCPVTLSLDTPTMPIPTLGIRWKSAGGTRTLEIPALYMRPAPPKPVQAKPQPRHLSAPLPPVPGEQP